MATATVLGLAANASMKPYKVPPSSKEWTETTRAKFHQATVVMGYHEGLARRLFNECKATARDPDHCVRFGLAIMGNESSKGYAVDSRKSAFGVSGASFDTVEESAADWVKRYNKYWHKQTSMG